MTFKKAIPAFAVLALLTIASIGATAQCGGIDQFKGKLKPQAWLGSGVRSGSLLLASEREDNANDGEGIVGFWRVTFISKGNGAFGINDGDLLDHGFAVWHSDHTEIMNSNRQPRTGSFCLGVWKKVGPSHYKLNHFAISFDDQVTLGYANLREDVFLSQDSDSFTGSVSLAIFDGQGHAGPVLNGDLVGTRVKVNTTLGDIL